jgi:protein-L-isoaspartate(D-aspartate) O-methyltransferase
MPPPDAVSDALAMTPRTAYIPHRVYDHTGRMVHRDVDPAGWDRLTAVDAPVVIQLDNGVPGGPGRPTATVPGRTTTAHLLRAAELSRGRHTLEIGTGTGYGTAVMCRLTGEMGAGSAYVTSVEIDPAAAEHARRALAAHDQLDPWVVDADGSDGCESRGVYDRVVSTVAVGRIPPAWLRQTRIGGRIVTPWTPQPAMGASLLLSLDVVTRDDGRGPGRASGRFRARLSALDAMCGRGELRPPRPETTGLDGDPDVSELTHLSPDHLLTGGGAWVLWVRVPAWTHGDAVDADGIRRLWIASTRCPSWALISPAADRRWRVEQAGPRRMWDELITARRWWQRQGHPSPAAFGATAHSDGRHEIWYRQPGGDATWDI